MRTIETTTFTTITPTFTTITVTTTTATITTTTNTTATTTTTTTTTTSSTVEENDQMTFIYILLGVVIIFLAAILGVVIKIMKKRRETEISNEENENYGRAMDFEQYYEDEKNAKIVDTNDYY